MPSNALNVKLKLLHEDVNLRYLEDVVKYLCNSILLAFSATIVLCLKCVDAK